MTSKVFSSKYSAQDANYPLNFLYRIIVDERDAYNTISGIQLGRRIGDEAVCIKMAKTDTDLCDSGKSEPDINRENRTHISLLVKLGHDILALNCTLAGDHKGDCRYP
jgi:hypothetical protein